SPPSRGPARSRDWRRGSPRPARQSPPAAGRAGRRAPWRAGSPRSSRARSGRRRGRSRPARGRATPATAANRARRRRRRRKSGHRRRRAAPRAWWRRQLGASRYFRPALSRVARADLPRTDYMALAEAPLSDIAIARATPLQPIERIAAGLGIPEAALYRYGPYKAKLTFDFLDSIAAKPEGKLILVTAISPTAAGEGKTTTTIGLGDALARLGRRICIALREPSAGPVFGAKGGATGGGKAQVAPMDEINLHFTGDFHAITAANNLLAALIDNHLYWGNKLGLDARRISWRRCLDMNDRALRNLVLGLGGPAHGVPREDGFDITVASPVMALFCLAESLADLERRLGEMVIGQGFDKKAVKASALGAQRAMTALLRDALQPNLVQTLEGTPALVHGGPFANIAHGCNSVMATRTALKLADYVVTEAGFGADLGAEKFLDIKCRKAGLAPSCAVVVATVRALKMNGGVAKADLGAENVEALKAGLPNLLRHVENMQ